MKYLIQMDLVGIRRRNISKVSDLLNYWIYLILKLKRNKAQIIPNTFHIHQFISIKKIPYSG